MVAASLGALWAAVVALLLWRAVVQLRSYRVLPPGPDLPGDPPTVAVIVPARDEAHAIARCLNGILGQKYPPGRLSVTVVDDGSTDGTAGVLADIAARAGGRLRAIRGQPLQGGWTGKCYACWQGAARTDADWLCFLDADTVPAPALVNTAVACAEAERLDMLSLQPFQVLHSFAERLVLPAGFFLIAFFLDLRRSHDPLGRKVAANGQFILVRRETYMAAGGHSAVRGEIAEDAGLARLLKAAGCRVAVRGGERLLRTRMYRGLRPLWEGLSKNVTELAGGAGRALAGAAAALAIGWGSVLAPAWASLEAGGIWSLAAAALAGAGSLALFAAHAAAARRFRIPVWYALLLPAAYTATALLGVHGVIQRRQGRVKWKGRVYGPKARPE